MPGTETLKNVPPTLFSCVMGIGGLGLAWHQAALAGAQGPLGTAAAALADGLTLLAAACFVGVAAIYGLKVLRHPQAVVEDALHPAQGNFLATIPIGAMIVLQGLAPHGPETAVRFWFVAAGAQIVISAYTVTRWIAQDQDVRQLNPSWFIPVAGNLVAPAGAVMAGVTELGWFFFSVGVTFWLVLFTITFYRMLFHDPLPIAACPTLAILIAPPALAFIAYTALTGGTVNELSRLFLYSGLFLAAVVLGLSRRFLALPFSLSWWAYTFPIASLTSALFIFARETGYAALPAIASVILALASAVVALTAFLTLRAAWRGTLFDAPAEMEDAHAGG